MNQKQKIILVAITILLLVHVISALLFTKETNVIAKEEMLEEKKEPEETLKEHYKVDIKGQVNKPGVYEIDADSRVIDVINLAGGLKKDANTDFLNLSKKVEDGSVIWIYTTKEIEQLKKVKTVTEYIEKECNCPDVSNSACITNNPSEKNNTTQTSKVNINTSSIEELMKLSGIGEAKAKAIIEYRKKNPFKNISDIKNVSGIGDSAYEKIKDFITVS